MTLILNLHNNVSNPHLQTKFGEKNIIGYKDMAPTNINSSLVTLTFDLDIKFAQYHFFVLPANQIW